MHFVLAARRASRADRAHHEIEIVLGLGIRPRVVVCLGAFAWDAGFRQLAPALRPRPRFGHGTEAAAGDLTMLGCFHPSQQNTFTGKLTPPMIDAVLERARALADQARSAPSASMQ